MCRTSWQKTLVSVWLVTAAVAGCTAESQQPGPATREAPVKKIAVGKNVFVEVEDRKVVRVVVQAYVCNRTCDLEHFLCRRHTKEHEAILAADMDARNLHTALLLAGAEPGKPITFRPQLTPPSGPVVKISLLYRDQHGQQVRVPAQQWVRHNQTKKPLQADWVFVGSVFIPDPLDPTKPPFYAANDGNVICIANFEDALLDLPMLSSASENEYETHTERIPPVDTPVLVILEPMRTRRH